MGRYLKPIFEALLTAAGLITLTFILLRFLPGGPFDDEASLHPLVQAHLQKAWALDQSLLFQYLKYWQSLLLGDWGQSMSQPGRSVLEVLLSSFQITLWLNLISIFVVFALSFIVATTFILSTSKIFRSGLEFIILVLISLPSLFLSPLLIYLFSVYWNLLPSARLLEPSSYILPILAISLRPTASMSRILIQSWQENLNQEYMRYALAKGLSFRQAIFRHALKNSLIPVVNYSGPLVMGLFSGSFLVELLFVIPGLGTLFVRSLETRDYPVVMGLTLISGLVMIFCSFCLDFINRQLDPRWGA